VLRLDDAALAQRNRLEQGVLQLPHVARPVIAGQALQRLRRERRQRTADLPAGLVDEVQRQRLQSVQTIAQRRNVQRQHVEPVIQVLAKLTLGAELGQVHLGRADHPHIQIDLFVAADPTEAAVLQEAQQLGLQPRAHLADAIEKQRTACGQLQQAELAFRPRAFEGAGAVAEQLGLGHRLRQAGAVERHEG